MGGSLATDGVEGTSGTLPPPPIARQGAYEVVLALTDLRGANPVLRTRGGTGPVARYNDPILIAGLGWSGGQVYINTVQGRRIANAYIEAYRAIVTAVERQLKNATRKKD
jgi:hypothetical protein